MLIIVALGIPTSWLGVRLIWRTLIGKLFIIGGGFLWILINYQSALRFLHMASSMVKGFRQVWRDYRTTKGEVEF